MAIVGRTPLKRPKFDSRPQTATTIAGGTWYFAPTRFRSAACCCVTRRAVRMVGLVKSPLQILIEREQQLGLAVIALEHDGHRLQPVERTIERGFGDPP